MKKYKPETFGVMLDLSRNAVMSIPSFKKYLGYLKKMGYNAAQELYARVQNSLTKGKDQDDDE